MSKGCRQIDIGKDPASTEATIHFAESPAASFGNTQHKKQAFSDSFGTPGERQLYTDRSNNVRVESSSLILEAHREIYTRNDKTCDYTFGMVFEIGWEGKNREGSIWIPKIKGEENFKRKGSVSTL